MDDAKAVWFELESLVRNGELRRAILEDGPAGALAVRLIERVREWKRAAQR